LHAKAVLRLHPAQRRLDSSWTIVSRLPQQMQNLVCEVRLNRAVNADAASTRSD